MASRTHRKFIAAIVSLSLVITGFGTSEAAARDRSGERALAAIVGLAVLGAIIHKDRKKDRRRHAAHQEAARLEAARQEAARKEAERQKAARRKARHQGDWLEARPLPSRVNRHLLPARCLRSFSEGDRRIRMFPKRCLHRHYGYSDELPLRCERWVRTERGVREGYAARCLRREGYQLARD